MMASLLLQGALLVSVPVLLFLTVYFVLVPNAIKVSAMVEDLIHLMELLCI